MVNYILSKSPNGLFLIFERSVQFDFTIRQKEKVNFYFSFAVIQESIKLRCELKVLEGTFYAKEYYF